MSAASHDDTLMTSLQPALTHLAKEIALSATTGAAPATASREAPGQSPPGRRRPGVALLVIATAQLMVVLDSTAEQSTDR